MKILILSDIHGNREALEAINEKCDYVFCLGDIIDYGPDPLFAVNYILLHGDYVVKGNHDHAIGFNTSCKCSEKFTNLSIATRDITKKQLPIEKIKYLRYLPITQKVKLPGVSFLMVHALPSNPLYKYFDEDNKELLKAEAEKAKCDFVFLGHSHFQWMKKVGKTTFVNPGSVGMAKDKPGYASYAIWENGKIELKNVEYDLNKTCKKITDMQLESKIKDELIYAFRSGKVR